MHMFFRKYRGALIGACALIRTNTVFGIHRKKIFLLYTIHGHFPIHKPGLGKKKRRKKKNENTNNIPYVLTKKMNTRTLCFRS